MQTHTDIINAYFHEVWNNGQLHLLDSLLTADYVNHTPSGPPPVPGPEGLKPIVTAMRKAIPDMHYTIDEMIVSDTVIVVRVTFTGTQTGDLFGLPPTGKKFSVSQINIEHFRDGRIASHYRITDELGMLRQLGVVN
ncbi:MAG TPA: ester cyclase [Chitinophaga sp.]|uniref:ester cyclase n=1 Tax=Chitinophaga sp. TaxID=1869181 RepID=UPI002BEA9DDB|nr:ester cyclase [Chitinophaga sp.]HVI47266.1 ester cyclase [Chitinophaga sp.]